MFTVAGVSRFKGEVKVRFANDFARVKMLMKAGNTDIELVELPEEMDKPQAVLALRETELYKNPEFAMAIDDAIDKYNPTRQNKDSRKPTRKVVSLDNLRARAAAKSENA